MFRIVFVTLAVVLSTVVHSATVVIKFHEHTGVELSEGAFVISGNTANRELFPTEETEPQLSSINVAVSSSNAAVVRTFDLNPDALLNWKANAESYWNTELEDLSLYFSVAVNPSDSVSIIDTLLNLEGYTIVESVEEIPDPEPALVTPSLEGNQGYLDNNPHGVHAREAWTLPGGKGNSVKAVDIEGAWQVTHEDMPDLFYNSGSFNPVLSWRNHGTAVLGVMGGLENSYGITGIAPEAQYGVQSAFIDGGFPAAITLAAMQAGTGGLVIIELHYEQSVHVPDCSCNTEQCGFVPAEFFSAHYQAIKQAVGNGVIVIQAAGNGSVDLDHPDFNSIFDRKVQDSGAIMVGASLSAARTPACFTNYGSRIDLHGWGENVTTMGYGDAFSGGGEGEENKYYTNIFGGTSSASPIVAGSALSVQGILDAHGQPLLDSVQMRELLSATGAAQTDGFSKNIGKLPNIVKAVNQKGVGVEPMAVFTHPAGGEIFKALTTELISWNTNGASASTSYLLQAGRSCVAEDVITENAESNPSSFTESNAGGQYLWTSDTNNPYEGAGNWHAENPDVVGDQYLASPMFLLPKEIPGSAPTLTFWHSYNVEPEYDGGVVEVTTDGGNNWIDLGEHMTENPYNLALSAGENPLAGRGAFSGSSGGYIQTTVDLSPFAGSLMSIRFRFGSDDSVGLPPTYTGWDIDLITVTGASPHMAPIGISSTSTFLWDITEVPGNDYCLSIQGSGPEGMMSEVFSNLFDIDPASQMEVNLVSSCLAGNGRVDLNIVNTQTISSDYQLEFGNLDPREVSVAYKDWGRLPITGRLPGLYPAVVTRDGEVILDTEVAIDCSAASPPVSMPEVTIVNACRGAGNNGQVFFQFVNPTALSRPYVIEFDGVPNRSTSTGPFGQSRRGTTGRPDGTYNYSINSLGQAIDSGQVTVDCD